MNCWWDKAWKERSRTGGGREPISLVRPGVVPGRSSGDRNGVRQSMTEGIRTDKTHVPLNPAIGQELPQKRVTVT